MGPFKIRQQKFIYNDIKYDFYLFFSSLYDYENYLETGGRVQNLAKVREDRLCPVVRGTFWEPCRYNKDDFSNDIEAVCTTLEELNEFAECQQGCDEIRPNTEWVALI